MTKTVFEIGRYERLKHKRFFDRLKHKAMPTQHAHHLLRYSGLPKVHYLMRVLKPSISLPALLKFDELVLSTYSKKCNLPARLSQIRFTKICRNGSCCLLRCYHASVAFPSFCFP